MVPKILSLDCKFQELPLSASLLSGSPLDDIRGNKPRPPSGPFMSSPYRKICSAGDFEAELSFHKFSRFDKMLALLPLQILELLETYLDYICGVDLCRKRLLGDCHTYGEKCKVARTKPLDHLMNEELYDPNRVARNRVLARLYVDFLLYWKYHGVLTSTPESCSNCSSTTITLCSTPVLPTAESEPEFPKKKYKSLKEVFVAKLSRAPTSNVEEFVSYLHYRLSVREDMSLLERLKEIGSRRAKY